VLTYTPDGRRIVTGGSNSAIRVYTVGEDGEPKTIDDGVDGNLGVVATVCWASVRAADGLMRFAE
jgi:chromosome transmission fidelity protein 4